MSTKDVIKKSILEGFSMEMSTFHVVSILLITVLLSVYIFYIYRLNSHSSFYSRDFNKTLAIMPRCLRQRLYWLFRLPWLFQLGIGSGALSIVRFRNAIKNPMDLLFLFWSISTGIICGAGLYMLAIVTCLVVTILSFLLDFIKTPQASLLLVLNSSDKGIEKKLLPVLESFAKGYKIRSRNVTAGGIDYVVELKTKDEMGLIDACSVMEGMDSVSLLTHDGDIRY